MQLYSARRPSGTKIIACNKLHAINCMQQIACNYFRIWAWAIAVNQCVTGDVISEISSDEELLLLSHYSTKCCHWLEHFGLMNIFEHAWKPAIIACNDWRELHVINCTCNHVLTPVPVTTVIHHYTVSDYTVAAQDNEASWRLLTLSASRASFTCLAVDGLTLIFLPHQRTPLRYMQARWPAHANTQITSMTINWQLNQIFCYYYYMPNQVLLQCLQTSLYCIH